ncbi:MAG: hypothetical protein EA382_10495 [Spirochaetaceae bacterium]|nr:MAG: hypothetical protein EA382_10495 [Spirochaetaceae bacterium]
MLALALHGTLAAETLRGPRVELRVDAASGPQTAVLGVESVLLVSLGDNARFIAALEIELSSPAPVGDLAGAVHLTVIAPINETDRSGIAEAVGDVLLAQPLVRAGRTFYQIRVSNDAPAAGSAAIMQPSRIVPAGQFPIALSVIPRMKGLSPALRDADFQVTVRPVLLNIGSLRVTYQLEDGTFISDTLRAPGFTLAINGADVTVAEEYLLPPGLHRVVLSSRQYIDHAVTVGVEQGRETRLTIPLQIALARVAYTAPRDAQVYLNGTPLDGARGDFTVPPGEHTIVVLVGDYSITRRFRVDEGRRYSMSILIDIAVEEIK